MTYDPAMSPNDAGECSNLIVRTLEFHIRDVQGNYLNIHGAHVTFNIVFSEYSIFSI